MPVITTQHFHYPITSANGRLWVELNDLQADVEIDEDGEILAVEAIHGHYDHAVLPPSHPLWSLIADYIMNVADSEKLLGNEWREMIVDTDYRYDLMKDAAA